MEFITNYDCHEDIKRFENHSERYLYEDIFKDDHTQNCILLQHFDCSDFHDYKRVDKKLRIYQRF